MKARTAETRLLKDGRVNPAFLDKPVPLVYQGKKVGSVSSDGRVDLPDRQKSWSEYTRAGDIETELKIRGAHKVFMDGKVIAVVVRAKTRS